MKYFYEAPIWVVAILCSFAVVVSVACFMMFWNWQQWNSVEPQIIRWLFLVMALGFLVAGIKPTNWKRWRYFYADDAGIHFPSECPETKDTEWLIVPWKQVGEIKKDVFYSRYKGPSIELLLSDDEITRFFRGLRLTKMFLAEDIVQNGYFTVGYSNAFKSADNAVRTLNEYKSKHT